MQVAVYLTATVLLPYVLNPKDEAAWILFKSYFPGTYYFYCGALIFCFFGTVKQWKMWKTTNLIAAAVTCLAMLPLVLHAWWPSGLLTPNGVKVCNVIGDDLRRCGHVAGETMDEGFPRRELLQS